MSDDARASLADEHPGRGSAQAADLPAVVFVSSHAALGGSEQVLEDVLGCLPPAVVSGVVSLQAGPFVDRLRDGGTAVEVARTGASPAHLALGALRLRRVLRRLAPDVVHANGSKAALVAVLARSGRPVVWLKHDVYRDGRLSRWVARRCAAVPSVSGEVARDVAGSGRTSVVHPGVRVDVEQARRDAQALRERLGLDGPVVAVVGRLDPTKGHAELLEALPGLRERVPGALALLVGDDDPQHPGVRERLRARAAELDVGDAVRLPGRLPGPGALAASTVACVPTTPTSDGRGREGFGLVAAEAMLLGVPVVAYDVGATAEVLAGCGLTVPAADRSALTAALARVLTDPSLRDRLAGCGRERAAELTVERAAAQLLALYRAAA